MRILFIHQNFPGQFKLLPACLAQEADNQVVCLGGASNIAQQNHRLPFQWFCYNARLPKEPQSHHYLHSFEQAIRRGQDVVTACKQLRASGFVPDLIIGHPAWGELLFIKDLFPVARLIAYFEFFYQDSGADFGFDPEFRSTFDDRCKLRIRNSTQLHALSECDAGISPTSWQHSTYPVREQPRIRVIHEGFNLDLVRRDAKASFRLPDGRKLTRQEKVITFVSRQLEPYRGFHVFMRALPALQRAIPDAQFVIVGGDGVSYGSPPPPPYTSYRVKLLAEVGDQIDASRTHFVGRLPYTQYLSLMQISRLHVYLTYPFVLSWSMLEAMACGAPVLGSATPPVKEVIRDGVNGYLFDFFNVDELVACAVKILAQNEGITSAIREAARHEIESRFSFNQNSLPAYQQLIRDVILS